jgi:hypothetical protein
LDTAVSQVIKGIGYILNKYILDNNDSVIVNSIVELLYSIFNRLYSKEWLNYWDITAALEITNRPVFVRLGLSIPLYKKEANGKVILLPNPLYYWRKKIDNYRYKGKNDSNGL